MAEAKPTGVSISLSTEGTAAVNAAIRRLVAAGSNTRSPMRAITARLLASTTQNFQREQDPSGKQWQPLSLVTIEMRKQKYRGTAKVTKKIGRVNYDIGGDNMKILQDTARLIQSIHSTPYRR
ncbi:MAG: phage virion morphogenesis protein [Alphaproteobacteria bacterium]|nr:phage virion morphogenesis protein [Alphaproteobacteria bacterium]